MVLIISSSIQNVHHPFRRYNQMSILRIDLEVLNLEDSQRSMKI